MEILFRKMSGNVDPNARKEVNYALINTGTAGVAAIVDAGNSSKKRRDDARKARELMKPRVPREAIEQKQNVCYFKLSF